MTGIAGKRQNKTPSLCGVCCEFATKAKGPADVYSLYAGVYAVTWRPGSTEASLGGACMKLKRSACECECVLCKKRNRPHTQTHDPDNITDDHAKNHPPHLSMICKKKATTTTTTEGAYRSFFDLFPEEELPDTGGSRVLLPRCNFWSSGHPALRRRPCSALRSAFVVGVVSYEGY